MDTMLLRVFQAHVADQCNAAMMGASQMNVDRRSFDHDVFWIGCQNLCTGAANVAKALWGIKGSGLFEPRRPLRESLGVSDNSPLRNVDMRNAFEHLDERIDEWWGKSGRHRLVDRSVGPLAYFEQRYQEVERFRIFDPTTMDISFWGTAFQCSSGLQRGRAHTRSSPGRE